MGTRDEFLNSSESITNNDDRYSIIRSCEILNEGYNSAGGIDMTSCRERSDDYGVSSDSDMIVNGRYKNDAKLRKRCAVVITPTKEIIQYERKRNEMYNEILQKQRRKLELRAIEKQREKERRRLGRREEKREQTKSNNREAAATATASDKVATYSKRTRNYKEIFMSSESEYETNFQVRTRKHRQDKFQELEPLNIQIEMTEATTTSLLSQIDAHLDKPTTEKSYQFEVKEKQEQSSSCNKDINQQICDTSCDKSSPTKMRELNLLADIAQHLSPYQLDLPENNNPPRTPSPAYEPPPIPIPPAAPTPQQTKEVPKEKVTVTEHLIIQSLDNLLEKTNTQFNNNDQQQQAFNSYAHEPQLNMAAISKTSPCENVSQNQNQQNNTHLENNDDNPLPNNCTDKELNSNVQTDRALEQILEESMSVLKSVTSPFNALNECPATAIRPKTCSDSTIPLLISNVESLNHIEQNDTSAKTKSDDKLHLLLKDATKNNFENVVLSEGNELHNHKETDETNKNVTVEQRGNETATDLPSSILEQGETSIMCSTDLAHISNKETEISQTLKPTSLLAADLSDISLESEISKNLPEIAEPSPVVTDMSDNSTESEVSKSFGLPIPISNTGIASASGVAEMSLPDLSLVMTNIAQSSALSTNHQQEPLESSFNQFNCTLNTPTKLVIGISRAEEPTNNSINDLNTPLKFAIQPELESNSVPPKITLEPEADNNVTKFLDLILNKTVTDAESETRDKIIKELNALTADTTAAASLETRESNTNIGIVPPESNTGEDEENKTLEAKKTGEISNAFEEQTNSTTHNCKTQQTLEYSSKSHIENNSSAAETVKSKTSGKEPDVLQIPSENNELNLNPPIASSVEEEKRSELLSDIATTELSDTVPSTSLSACAKFKLPAVKQTFNIKCRVRLKRLNIDEHCKSPHKETWMAIPISRPEESVSSNNHISKCDTVSETTTRIKKACLKNNNKQASEELEEKTFESFALDTAAADVVIPNKKAKLEVEQTTPIETTPTVTTQQSTTSTPTLTQTQALTLVSSQATAAEVIFNTTSTSPPNSKPKSKPLKTVTFDLSNLNEELRESAASNHRQKSKSHHAASIAAGALGCYLKNSRPPRKLPDNTLRAAETLQIFVNTINDSTRTPPPAEFNKKRSPIKNKCIAEDETPRPPPASTLMGTPPCKKTCTEKSRSQITSSKCKDQLVSSLSTASISNISDISTARIYTSSPLDQTLPEYDDNVDTVADSELILPTTAGSLRRKLKRPKKSMTRPEPVDDISTDDISNQPECNGEDDTDAVVDNEDDVFAEELLPIPAANEHILEEIVSGRPSHIGTGTVIRDDYMNIEATATVPVYLFNDESSDLVTPDPVQSSNATNVVDSSSYLNTSSSAATNNGVAVTTASTTSAMVNLEKSMLSPSEHEVSSTQETFYQTPTKSKQTEAFAEKSSTSKDKGNSNSSSAFLANSISKQKPDDNKFQNNEQYQTSSTTGLLQNNQVDTTNHSPEMCTLSLTATTTTTTTLTSNRKIRKASTHDEILLNELQQQQQQQLPSNKRKSTATTFCCESTSDNNSNSTATKTKAVSKNLEEVKSNGSLIKVEDKFKKLLKEVCKRDKNQIANDLDVGGLTVASNNSGGGGGSSPSTTTTILEEKISRSKRKKLKSSKSKKNKSHSERSSKIVLKASKLTPHIPANPLIITIPKSRLLRPPSTPTPPTAVDAQDEQQQNEFLDIPNAKLFIEKNKETTITTAITTKNSIHHTNPHNHAVQSKAEQRQEIINATVAMTIEPKRPDSPINTQTEILNVKTNKIFGSEMEGVIHKANSTILPKEKSHSSTSAAKKKEKVKTNHNANSSSTTCTNTNNNNNNNIIFVKDKYDLIKSKDKHHHQHQHHHDQHEQQQDIKEKSKAKTSSQSKAATTNNTRLHKSSTKEKIKGEKHKEKQKGSEKSANQQLQPDIVLKLNTLQGSNKSLSSSSTSTATSTLSSSNAKQSSSKSKRSNSSSSSSSSATSAILKSKTNLSTTQSSATTAVLTAAPSQITTATLSTNNVRKKLKIK